MKISENLRFYQTETAKINELVNFSSVTNSIIVKNDYDFK